MKPTILCDIDGVLLDFTRVYLDLVEQLHGRKHSEHEIFSFNYHESIVSKDEDAAIWQHISKTPNLVYNLPQYEGAMAFLGKLRLRGRVVACTSPAGALWTAERAAWLFEQAGFGKKDIVVASDKTLIGGDYLVDDHYDNISGWEDARASLLTSGLGILFTRPWNLRHSHHSRAWNYSEVLDIIDELEES